MSSEYLYRYEDHYYSPGLDQFDDPIPGYILRVELKKYKIVKRTPKGVWIRYYRYNYFDLEDNDKLNRKFVLLTARKKYACLTKGEALESFVKRKVRQSSILEDRLKRSREAMMRGIAMQRKLKDEHSESRQGSRRSN